MNAVIKRTSFAAGNYVSAEAFANAQLEVNPFNANARLIDKVKTGRNKLDAMCITAIQRSDKNTRVSNTTTRELTFVLPADLAVGKYEVKSRDDVAFSFKNSDGKIYEGVSGEIEIEPASDENVKGRFNINIDMPDNEENIFILKGKFQVLKAG
ncbi:DUF6252 family protein [Pseudomonas sp. RIT288]|jgi:hypothetical protein|uniref:DUF6252 family protein n=1 Tax=Pseudomonas sp. RIT288 TaxID=1470589 RepID=UPI0004493193|nr:DUF6252 family protein [Pseudomonas sp. RIT288]EZP25881.1 hypothetical protein BW33_05308 [Pseudomonas sp. RIT288]